MNRHLPTPRRAIFRADARVPPPSARSGVVRRRPALGLVGRSLLRLILSIFFRAFRSSGAYKEAMARATAHPGVAAALGTPIRAGFWVGGSIHVNGPSGSASFTTPLHGSVDDGTLRAAARKTAGVWRFDLLQIRLSDGAVLDLLASPSAPDALPGAPASLPPAR